MDGWMDWWMDGWLDGWMDWWMDGWIGGWVVGCTDHAVGLLSSGALHEGVVVLSGHCQAGGASVNDGGTALLAPAGLLVVDLESEENGERHLITGHCGLTTDTGSV